MSPRRSPLRRPTAESDAADWRFVYAMTLGGGLLLALLHGLLSGMAFKCMFALLPLSAPLVVALYRQIADVDANPNAARRACVVAAATSVALGVACYAARFDWSYGTAPLHTATAEFAHPRLAGVRSTPRKVTQIDSAAQYLASRVARGDLLLVVGHAPILYFVTSTRPALDHTWTAPQISPEVRLQSIQRMVERGRVPEYAVRHKASNRSPHLARQPGGWMRFPTYAFLFENYTLEATFNSLEIWKHRKHKPKKASVAGPKRH